MTGADPAEVGRKIKAAIADGLATAKAQPGITVKSGATHTYPVYSKGGRTIESWRMRSEIVLESREAAALSAAVGKLQSTLPVSNINFAPRRKPVAKPKMMQHSKPSTLLRQSRAYCHFNEKALQDSPDEREWQRQFPAALAGNAHFSHGDGFCADAGRGR